MLTVLASSISARAQTTTVTGSVEIRNHSHQKSSNNTEVVVWLVPLPETGSTATTPPAPSPVSKKRFTLVQKNKTFEPHVLVLPAGSEVDFPNLDPFFHNVFSLFEGKRFDLGLYESGTTRSLRMNRPGISYLFCNIHPEMSAVIVVLETPYYATSNATGQITIPGVPAGRYSLHVWREGVSPDALKNLSRPVLVSGSSVSFGKLLVPDSASFPLTHKNKYGQDYENPNPPGHVYIQP